MKRNSFRIDANLSFIHVNSSLENERILDAIFNEYVEAMFTIEIECRVDRWTRLDRNKTRTLLKLGSLICVSFVSQRPWLPLAPTNRRWPTAAAPSWISTCRRSRRWKSWRSLWWVLPTRAATGLTTASAKPNVDRNGEPIACVSSLPPPPPPPPFFRNIFGFPALGAEYQPAKRRARKREWARATEKRPCKIESNKTVSSVVSSYSALKKFHWDLISRLLQSYQTLLGLSELKTISSYFRWLTKNGTSLSISLEKILV